jgi:hypothetical protein
MNEQNIHFGRHSRAATSSRLFPGINQAGEKGKWPAPSFDGRSGPARAKTPAAGSHPRSGAIWIRQNEKSA